MKKEKIIMAISIGIACFALSLVMFMQFKVVQQTDITAIQNMRESELRKELAEWRSKYEEIDIKYEETSQKVSEYRQKKESNNEATELLEKEYNQINKALGKTNVQGEGIVVTISNIQGYDTVNAEDLLVVVNQLKNAGAEAIEINEERIINMSDIVSINTTSNNSFIKINGKRIQEPYIIKSIGNQTYLEGALKGTGGKIDELENLGFKISIQKERKIEINKYNDEITTKYIKE